jgi:hypothetical protein
MAQYTKYPTSGSTGTVTSVAATVPSFLSIAGSPITTSGTLAITYSGVALPILNGGTGQTTANAALNALLPSQTSNANNFLQTDGTNTSWVANAALTVGTFDSGTASSNGAHIDTGNLIMQSADATNPGLVNTTTQSFAGIKTFNTGTVSPSFSSSTANTASTGVFRLANNEAIRWRNAANSANLALAVNTSNQLQYAGTAIFSQIIDSGATASTVPYFDTNSQLTSSAVTPTELGYVSGVTSAIQTQLNAKGVGTVTSVAASVPSIFSISGSPITSSGTLAMTYSGTALPLLNGGTGQTTKAPAFDALSPMTTGGDLIYGGASGTGTRLANGSAGQVLQSNGTTLAPSWVAAGTGTVTSVGLSVPATSIFGTSGTPVTTSGTLGLTTTGTSGGIPYFSSTSALSSSAALTASAIVLGGGAGASPTAMASLGTTTTVLHGNAAGAPTFGSVALGTDVSGTLAAAQFPVLTGDITTSAGALATTAAATQANIVTLSKSTGVAVHGTNTNDSAAAGYVGEYVSAAASAVSFGTSTQYADACSISLTAGDWDISYVAEVSANGGTLTTTFLGVGTATGNNGAGVSAGDNGHSIALASAVTGQGGSMANYRVSITATTTYYLKSFATYTIATPKITARLSARRIR